MASTQPALDLSLEEAEALAPAVTPQEAAERVAAGALLIDVRSEAGRSAHGTIPGAAVVDRNQLDALFDADSPSRLPHVTGADAPVVVMCGTVRGSGPVAAYLREKGFTDVVQLTGGFPGWQEAGLPIEPPPATSG